MSAQEIKKIILRFNEKLLALSTRNRLISSTFNTYSESFMFIDELPQQLAEKLATGMVFQPLPPLKTDPLDEKTKKFTNMLEQLKLTDDSYIEDIKKINTQELADQDQIYELEIVALRALKNRLRDSLGMSPLPSSSAITDLKLHARNFKINPEYDLPHPQSSEDSAKHSDNKIQTLFLIESLQARLNKVRNKYSLNLQETGLQTAYVCFGFIEWTDIKNSKKRLAPLMLLPVAFSEDRKDFSIKSAEDELMDNKTFRLYLENEFQLKLPKFPTVTLDESGMIDIEKYMAKIDKFVGKEKGWRVLRRASIGIFYTQELVMHEDLKLIAENPNELLQNLLSGGSMNSSDTVYQVDDPDYQAISPSLIEAADSSQHSAVIDMLQGNSFVLRGPPGTGKSQTICNMIAAGIADGKKILFIADKEAALEVVRSRLTSAGLDAFLLKAYSAKSSKKEFWGSVKHRLEGVTNQHDEKIYEVALRKLQETKAKLNEYSEFIGSKYGDSDIKIHDLLWEQEALNEAYPVRQFESARLQSPKTISSKQILDTEEILNEIEQSFLPVYVDHPWDSIKKVPLTPTAFKDFRNQVETWKNELMALQSLEKEGLPFEITTLSSINDINEFLIFLEETEKSISAENLSVIYSFIKLDPDGQQNLIGLLHNILQLQLDQKYFESNHLPETHLDEIFQIATSLSSLLPDAKAFQDIDESIKQYEDLIGLLNKISEMGDEVDHVTFEDFKILEQIKILEKDLNDEAKNIIRGSKLVLNISFAKKIRLLASVIESKEKLMDDGIELDNSLENIRDLKTASVILNKASFFSFLDTNYWNARKIFKSIAHEKFATKEMAIILNRVTRYQEDLAMIQDDADLESELSLSFRNENTSLSLVQSLLEYMEGLIQLNPASKLSTHLAHAFNQNQSKCLKVICDHLPNTDTLLSKDTSTLLGAGVMISTFTKNLDQQVLELTTLSSRAKELGLEERNIEEILVESVRKDRLLNNSELLKRELPLLLDSKLIECVMGNDPEHLTALCNQASELSCEQLPIQELTPESVGEITSIAKKCFEAFSKMTETLTSLCDSVEAKPFEGKVEQVTMNALIEFAKKDDQVAQGMMEYLQFRIIEAKLRESYQTNFYNRFASIFKDTRQDLSKFYKSWVRNEQYKDFQQDPVSSLIVNEFRGVAIDKLRTDLKNLDAKIQMLTRERVACLAEKQSADAPSGYQSNKVSEKTERELLEYGITKKTYPRGSVRDHISRSTKALAAFSPCWMLTPPNVSTFLPIEEIFDILIIDEASQMSPPKAFGAIARAKQMIVVGDEYQLPPTSFFQKADSDIEDDLDMDADESILDLAKGVWRTPRMLMWHYRSKHEDLIRFQNHFIYDSKLIIPPSTMGGDSEEFGVSNHYLGDSIYKNGGTNDDEADHIIKLLLRHVANYPKKSIGIAVVNTHQRDLINDKIRVALDSNPTLGDFLDFWQNHDEGLNKFFVKNLENVQGDERDVIIVGTVYGQKKPATRVQQSFGPINFPNGHRRLNVITTRARDQVHLVTSLKSSDIEEKNSLGKQFLAEYLDYSVNKKIVESSDSQGDPDSPFEEWAIDQIKSLGFQPIPQVGVTGFKIDIGVKHPEVGGYILGVECDGATYHSSPSARDRDFLRQEILESFGWTIYRIWSTDWIWDPQGTREKLRIALNNALEVSKKSLVHENV